MSGSDDAHFLAHPACPGPGIVTFGCAISADIWNSCTSQRPKGVTRAKPGR